MEGQDGGALQEGAEQEQRTWNERLSSQQVPLVAAAIVDMVRSGTSKCPHCSTAFSGFAGPQPSGTMTVSVEPRLQFDDGRGGGGGGAIVIEYSFNDGVQCDMHDAPGQRYHGTDRRCYLPLSDDGRAALALLRRAFELGKIFRVGQSVTTGREHQTVWAGIHHKTSPTGGAQNHGYPDPGWFDRLKSECAAASVM